MRAGQSRGLQWRVGLLVVATLLISAVACQRAQQQQKEAMGPTKFVSPQSAGLAVYNAAKADDTNALLAIFGPEAKDYVLMEDPNLDKNALSEFVSDYEHMHRWAPAAGGEMVLDVGVENYPFPFPLVKTENGEWVFSAERGKKEIEARTIGKNELTVIDILNEMADAQTEYFKTAQDGKVKQYAQRFTSGEGKHDGLYWKVGEGEPESPLGPLAARASAEGYQAGTKESPVPFHGYFFRILKEQGPHAEGGAKSYIVNGSMTRGFAFLAYPAEYRKTGVMTLMIGPDGRVFQKDLGVATVETAKAIKSFNPDDTWSIVE
jgi:Protein of unknown function (DUF2950)